MAAKKTAAKAPRKPRRPPSDESVARYALRSLTDVYPWGRYGAHLLAEQDASTVVKVTAILACNRFLAQSIACMPIRVMRRLANGRKVDAVDVQGRDTICRRPNGFQTTYEWVEQHVWHVGLYGNAYSRRVFDVQRGYVGRLLPLHPTRVDPWWASEDTLGYTLTKGNGTKEELAQDEVMHTRWLSDGGRKGLVPFELCGPALALARKLDEAALGYWDNGGRPDIVLETDETIPPDARKQMQADWKADHGGAGNRGGVAVLPKKVHLKTVEANTAEAMQFIELRDSIVPDMARVYGIPSTLLGDHRMAKYSNSEQEFLTAHVFGLMPWQRRLESSIDRSLLWNYGPEVYAKVDSRGLLRGDTAARTALYQALWGMGAITPNEIRDLEDLEPLDEPAADETFVQLGFSTLAAAAAQAAEPVTAGRSSPGVATQRNCGTGSGGFQDGNTCGKGGGGGGDAGSSGGSGGGASGEPQGGQTPAQGRRRERLRDRIEGTQKEADREVAKADRKVKKIEGQLAQAKAALSLQAAADRLAAAERALSDATARKNDLQAQLAASRQRTEQLKARLQQLKGSRATQDDIDQQLENEADESNAIRDGLVLVNSDLDDIRDEVESIA